MKRRIIINVFLIIELILLLYNGSFSVVQAEEVKYSNEWVGGKWYDADGSRTYCFDGEWKCSESGWWFEDSSGWYAKSEWLKIDGKYYYFTASGYLDYSEYRDGCWLGSDGAWVEESYGGHWCENSRGWWYVDDSGWYPADQYIWIDGIQYWFDAAGYLDKESWALILVNKNHPVPADYSVNLTTLANGEQVDSRIYPSLQNMFDDARAEGLGLFVREGYRTREEQQGIMNSRIKQYQAQGYSYSKAVKLAKQYVAVPGTSEHELGICVDINATGDSSSDAVYAWLDKNAYKYGFIKRYPQNKSTITGISYEPWHYRYVGKIAASEMYKSGMCLEEYMQ